MQWNEMKALPSKEVLSLFLELQESDGISNSPLVREVFAEQFSINGSRQVLSLFGDTHAIFTFHTKVRWK